MSLSLRATYLLIAAIVLSNFILWLDSFDRYLGSRYHVNLGEILPEAVFVPSRQLLALGGQSSEPVVPPEVEETEVEVLESVLAGDARCRFKIMIPESVLRAKGA